MAYLQALLACKALSCKNLILTDVKLRSPALGCEVTLPADNLPTSCCSALLDETTPVHRKAPLLTNSSYFPY
eukprot:scaffold51833_cov19-Tisochrysis_lutea.AAC.1